MAIGVMDRTRLFHLLTLSGLAVAVIFRHLLTRQSKSDLITQVKKGATTQGICQYLSSEYPTKNILVYHNKSSVFDGINNVHRSIKFPQFTGSGNDVYEVEVFDSGTFELAGESGYHNWVFCGSNWVQNRTSVIFHPHKESPVDSPKLSSDVSSAKQGGGYFPALHEGARQNGTEIKPRINLRSRSSSGSDPDWSREWNPETDQWDYFYDAADPAAEIQSVVEILGGTDAVIVEGALVGTLSAVAGLVVALAVVAALCVLIVALVFLPDFTAIFKQHKTESAYTQSAACQTVSANPAQNFVVFHDQDTSIVLTNSVHYHYELPLGYFSDTLGYELYQFDYGTVTLSGDEGWINWAFGGNWYRENSSSYVQFYPRNLARRSLLKRAQSETGTPVKRRDVIAPQVPLHSDPEASHGYYFVDCLQPDDTLSLGIAYYKDILPGGGNLAQAPDDYAEVVSNHAGKQLWQGEGDTTFANGMMFHWSFIHQGWDTAVHATAGIAETSFEELWIYKEAGGFLFNTAANWSCSAVYYAI